MKSYLNLIRIIFVLVLLFLIWLSLSGCATTSLKSENKVLDYYQSTPHHENLYWGIGSGANLKIASEESRVDISAQLYAKIYERIIRERKIENNDKKVVDEESLKILVRQETETTLNNVKRLDYKTSIDGQVHVLSYLNHGMEIPFNEQAVLDQLNRTYSIRKNTKIAGSVILPGTSQLLDGELLKGGMMLTGAAVAALGIIYGAAQMQSLHGDYLSAENSSIQQYYFNQYEDFKLLTIISGVIYLISSAVSVSIQ